jgi:hypothetical protein
MLGNPVTDQHGDENSRVKYFHRLTLISDDLYEVINILNPLLVFASSSSYI